MRNRMNDKSTTETENATNKPTVQQGALWTPTQAAELDRLLGENDFCGHLAKATDRMEFKRWVHDVVKRLGFSDFGFLRMRDIHDMSGWLFTLPWELLNTYHHNVYHEKEFVWQYLVKENKPAYCSDWYQWAEKSEFSTMDIDYSVAVYELIQNHGYADAYCIPLPSIDKGNVVFLVLSYDTPVEEFKRRVDEHTSTLELLGRAIDYVSTKYFPEFFIGNKMTQQIPMTPTSLKLLHTMLLNNWSLRQTAVEMGVSIKTLVLHFRAIMREFGTTTLAKAVFIATQRGLFTNTVYH